jgi:mono/diheme cytochrome c family protein
MLATSRLRILGLALLAAVIGLAGWRLSGLAQTGDPAQIELGARLFAENCAVCHGENGQGRVGATLAKDWPAIRPDLRVGSTIANGIPGSFMPAWSEETGGPLANDEIEALTAFILNWGPSGPATIVQAPTYEPRPAMTPLPDVEGDPNQGAVLFDENCAVCHGPDGQGRVGANLARPWSAIRPDLRIKDTITNGISGSFMPPWSQANGGPLTEAQINDLTAFLLVLPAVDTGLQPVETPAAPANPFFSGWGGVLVLIVAFVLVILLVLGVQSRRRTD